MRISVIGMGYVGLGVTSSFLSLGHKIEAIDINGEKIARLRNNEVDINEPHIQDVLSKQKSNIEYSTSYEGIKNSKVIFVCINTPEKKDWSVDTSMIDDCFDKLLGCVKENSLIVIKSTVPVGYTKSISEKFKNNRVLLAFIPEFLRQGHVYEDSMNPSRIVFGVENEMARQILDDLYQPFKCQKIYTSFVSAELAKYASNNFLATKISFINQVANFASLVGANIEDVRDIMELDPRIGKGSLNAGVGFGGGCLIKDTKALYKQSEDAGAPITISKEVINQNEKQKYLLLNELSNLFNGLEYLKENKILVVGVSFKADSSDLRNSIALDNLKVLSRFTNNFILYDPELSKESKEKTGYAFEDNLENGIKHSDILLIFVERREINDLDDKLFDEKIVLDGRNALSREKANKCRHYFSIGKGNIKKV